MFKLFQILAEAESPINGKIQVIKTFEGVRIVAGGISQSGWLVEKVWKAALKRIKKERPNVDNVCVLGLGGGSALKLINKYWPEAKITGVDIDPVMIDFGKKFLSLEKISNLEIVNNDAERWVTEGVKEKKIFDLILIDLYTGVRIPEQFKEIRFLEKIKKLLLEGGVVAFNHLYSPQEREDAHKLHGRLRQVFSAIVSIQPEANIIFIGYHE